MALANKTTTQPRRKFLAVSAAAGATAVTGGLPLLQSFRPGIAKRTRPRPCFRTSGPNTHF
ncbi:twin-arginine translocation signal domain-containing protein [Bradyrhizobium sp. USDA 3315]